MELREKVAREIANGPWHEGPNEEEARACADRILAIPEIAEALEYAKAAGDALMTGVGMVRITHIDPADVYIAPSSD